MATETKEKRKGAEEQVQVKWYGYIALLVGILFFSGLFQKAPGALKALDFNNVMGSFGTLGELTKGSGKLPWSRRIRTEGRMVICTYIIAVSYVCTWYGKDH